jgi:hypothetical protein
MWIYIKNILKFHSMLSIIFYNIWDCREEVIKVAGLYIRVTAWIPWTKFTPFHQTNTEQRLGIRRSSFYFVLAIYNCNHPPQNTIASPDLRVARGVCNARCKRPGEIRVEGEPGARRGPELQSSASESASSSRWPAASAFAAAAGVAIAGASSRRRAVLWTARLSRHWAVFWSELWSSGQGRTQAH